MAEAERHPSLADGLAAIREDRPEAPRRALERSSRRIEAIGEPRCRRRERNRRELARQGDVHQPEVRLERAVEMRGVVRAVELDVLARHHQPTRAEDVLEQRRERRRAVLGGRRARHQQAADHECGDVLHFIASYLI